LEGEIERPEAGQPATLENDFPGLRRQVICDCAGKSAARRVFATVAAVRAIEA